MKDLHLSRRQVLRSAGAVSILGVLAIPTTVFGEEDGANQMNLHFAARSSVASLGTTPFVLMAGDGRFGTAHIHASGVYQHIDPTTPKPNTILHAGTWKTSSLVSFKAIGTYGVLAAGILTMKVDLVQEIPSPAVMPATLTVVCNIGAAALVTGKDEGFSLEAPFGSFEPESPTIGITIFSTVDEHSKGL